MSMTLVALRKESVDRNINCNSNFTQKKQSLSARRAWIEISMLCSVEKYWAVALRKESVDRNFHTVQIVVVVMRRSPQGERG